MKDLNIILIFILWIKNPEHCEPEYDSCFYFDARKDLRIEYKYFKGNRLCTSKRSNKN